MRIVINVTDATQEQVNRILSAMNQKDIGQTIRVLDHATMPGWLNLRVLAGEVDVNPEGDLLPPAP